MGTRDPLNAWAAPGRVIGHVTPKAPAPDERAAREALVTAVEAREKQYIVDGVFVEPENEDHHEARLSTL